MIGGILFLGILSCLTIASMMLQSLNLLSVFFVLNLIGSVAAFVEGNYSLNTDYIVLILTFSLSLFFSSIFAIGIKSKIVIPIYSGQIWIAKKFNMISVITTVVALIVVLYSMDIFSSNFLRNVFKFRLAQINSAPNEYPGLLSSPVIYSFVKNSIILSAISVIIALSVLRQKRQAIFFLVGLTALNFSLGSRWTSMFFILSTIIVLGRHRPMISLKNLILWVFIFVIFFVGGYVRSIVGGLELSFWTLPYKYSFANFAAFNILVEENLYVPETFRYLTYLISGNANSIVADSVSLGVSGVKTNTYTIYAQFHQYLSVFGAVTYGTLLGLILVYCNKTYDENIISRVIYILTAPVVVLFMFTEPIFPQLALMLRLVVILIPTLIVGYFITRGRKL